MPGWNATQLAYKVQSGNSVVVQLGSQTIAFCQTADQGVDLGAEFLYGIGSSKPQEIQQLKFAPTIAITSFSLNNQGIKLLNYPSSLLEIIANNSFTFNVIDNTGTTLIQFVGAVCNNFSNNIPVNAIIQETLSFLAMDVLDGTGSSILDSNSALQSITSLAVAGLALAAVGV
jgi:hypothetical protein